jgi:hypothetical protein
MKEWIKRIGKRLSHKHAPAPSSTAEHSEGSGASESAAGDREKGAYSSDQPIKSKHQDRFQRWPFAKRIADTIAKRTDPSSLVVGLFGPWGDGKTSTLRMMEEALDAYPQAIVVRFNPWHFGSEEQLLKGFFATLADALGRSLSTRKEEIGGALKKYGSVLSVASIDIGHGARLSAGSAATSIGEALSAVELDELRQRVEKILRESGSRVVVLIDDIDRLDRSEIHAIFKLVKLSASFEYTCYVLAFDDEMVAAALGEKYGGGDAAAGRSFLEKIIQVPLHLPPADENALRQMVFEGADDALALAEIGLTYEQVEEFQRHFVDGIQQQLKTPRQAKLYANAMAFALPILKGEAHPVDLMLIEGMRVFYPKLYAAVRDNPDIFLRGAGEGDRRELNRRRLDELISAALDGSGVLDKERVRRWLIEPLFPRTGRMGYGPEWDKIWNGQQRIRTTNHFQRFFTYSVPPGDIGDRELEEFLNDVRDETADAKVDAGFKEIAKGGGLPRLIEKLRYREDSIDPQAAHRLMLAIARNGSLLPAEQGMMIVGGTRTQGAILIYKLLLRIDAAARGALATQVLTSVESLPFVAECLRWLRHSDDRRGMERVLDADEESAAKRLVADRIHTQAVAEPLYTTFGEDARELFWIWANFRSQPEVAEFIERWLNADAAEVDKFLDIWVGRAYGMESGLSRRSDFMRDAYDRIAGLIDPSFLFNKLVERHGRQLENPEYHHGGDTPLPLRLAHQFAFIHLAVLKERAAQQGVEVQAVEGAPAVSESEQAGDSEEG